MACGIVSLFLDSGNGIPNQNSLYRYVWHNEKDYHFQCGGSLLTPDLVITAAHCVYDEGTRLPYSYDTFRVIAAKFYRNYGETTPDDKRRDVRLIEIAP